MVVDLTNVVEKRPALFVGFNDSLFQWKAFEGGARYQLVRLVDVTFIMFAVVQFWAKKASCKKAHTTKI